MVRHGVPWTYDAQRYDRIAAARVREQDSMLEYQALPSGACRMAFLTDALDDPHSAPCDRCDHCAGVWYPTAIEIGAEESAQASLKQVGVAVAPRVMWPQGLDTLGVRVDGKPVRGKISEGERVDEGQVIARLTDLGHGNALRALFAVDPSGAPVDAPVPPDLLRAAFQVLKEWPWEQRPVAVVWVPSVSRPEPVESLATGIASAGRLQLLGPLHHDGGSPAAANSAFRVRDLWNRFTVPPRLAAQLGSLSGPVLLVDDLIDSKWTMTIDGRALRLAGAASVLPVALASVG